MLCAAACSAHQGGHVQELSLCDFALDFCEFGPLDETFEPGLPITS